MTDTIRKYAIDAAADGKFYLLCDRSLAADGKGFAAFRYPGPSDPKAFESAAAAVDFARRTLGAAEDDFAADPGRP